MLKKLLISILFSAMSWVAFAAPAQEAAPLLVGGNFSQNTNASRSVIFDQNTRDGEIAKLNERLKNKDYVGVTKRINELVSKNFLD